MELESIYNSTRESMSKILDGLKRDFTTLRTGKVTTAVVDNIKVDYYGTQTPISQASSVVAVDATTITINPWDKSLLNAIQKAIQEANIGVNPNTDGDTIKLFFPPMTTEQRESEAKKAKGFGEKSKISIRNIRKESNDKIKKMLKNKEITEDEEKKGLETIQKITDEFVGKVDKMVKDKEQDIKKI